MALKFFAVLAAVVGTGFFVLAFTGDNLSDKGRIEGITQGFLLWLTAVVLSAFADVVDYLKTIAENSAAWVEEDLVEEE